MTDQTERDIQGSVDAYMAARERASTRQYNFWFVVCLALLIGFFVVGGWPR